MTIAVIARINHETNSYSPVKTPIERFGLNGPDWGESGEKSNEGTNTAAGAFITWAKRKKYKVRFSVSGMALPSGPVCSQAYERMASRVRQDAEEGDIILLDLHGAMVTEDEDDPDGKLLEDLRRENPYKKIIVSLDLHGNVTEKMVRNADIITGFKTYPHVDMYEAGELAVAVYEKTTGNGRECFTEWVQLPLLVSPLKTLTTVPSAMQEVVEECKRREGNSGIYAATFFTGFGMANVESPFASVVVVGETRELARRNAKAIAQYAWDRRAGFVYEEGNWKTKIQELETEDTCRQDESKSGPTILLDHGDNCTAGGTCDVMDVLEVGLEHGLRGMLMGPVCDPEAVEAGWQEEIGEAVRIKVGNKSDLSVVGRKVAPLEIEGKIIKKGEGKFRVAGPTYTGMMCDMGRTIVIRNESVDLVITERTQEPWDIGVFECMELRPETYDYIVLKSKGYYQPVFGPMSKDIVMCDSGGVATAKWEKYSKEKMRRPVYPLDKKEIEDRGRCYWDV